MVLAPYTVGVMAGNQGLRPRRRQVLAAIEALPPSQREVEGCTAPEVCSELGLTETNQRVLLHRGRSRVRQTLASYFEEAR